MVLTSPMGATLGGGMGVGVACGSPSVAFKAISRGLGYAEPQGDLWTPPGTYRWFLPPLSWELGASVHTEMTMLSLSPLTWTPDGLPALPLAGPPVDPPICSQSTARMIFDKRKLPCSERAATAGSSPLSSPASLGPTPSRLLAATNLHSISTDLPIPDISSNSTHTIFVVLCLVSFTWHHAFKVHPHGSMSSLHNCLWLHNIPLHRYSHVVFHSSVDGCLGCFYPLTLMNSAAPNICV